jgi:hypothetical protein
MDSVENSDLDLLWQGFQWSSGFLISSWSEILKGFPCEVLRDRNDIQNYYSFVLIN